MKVLFGDLLPGETPIEDASGLLVPGIATRQELSKVEAENIRKVLVKYFARPLNEQAAPFDFEWVRLLHREMYGDVWAWAGQFRTNNLNIGVPFPQIQERLYNLLEDLRAWESSQMPLIEQAARLHYVTVWIHPFTNGNGRWSRMLTNIWLKIHDSPIIAWPEVAIGEMSPIRDQYIANLQAADDGDFEPLTELHRRYIEKS